MSLYMVCDIHYRKRMKAMMKMLMMLMLTLL